MIPQAATGGVQYDNLTGERAQFTIAANGKAFRVLIDGLYSNKIRAVTRELWSNAADAHVAAGNETTPFKVTVPTTLDPVFRVRDYGIGLSHADVMHLYTTVFQSTKEGTNDATGMLGLGSKSPFAYTDTFSVVTYSGTEQRTYIANIAANGVPEITHIETAPNYEPRGVEVSFPVNRSDVKTFQSEAQWTSIGFKTKPITVGMDLKMPVPRMEGADWAIYPSTGFGDVPGRTLIRQGVVCYPAQTSVNLGLNWIVIIDVPIGTADVTASRESLSYTNDTSRRIKDIISRVNNDMLAHINSEVAKATTRREMAMAHYEFNGILPNFRGSTTVSLLNNPAAARHYNGSTPVIRRPGDVLAVGSHYGKTGTRNTYQRFTSEVEANLIDGIRLFVDNGQRMVRKAQRVRAFCSNKDFVLAEEFDVNGDEIAVSWVVKHLELRKDQILSIHDCPDPGPPVRAPGSVSRRKVLGKGQMWLPRENGCTSTYQYGTGKRNEHEEGWSYTFVQAFHHLSANHPLRDIHNYEDIVYFTPLQAERLKLTDADRFDLALEKALKDEAEKSPLDNAIAVLALTDVLNGAQLEVVQQRFFSHLTMTRPEAAKLIDKAKFAKIDLQARQISGTIKTQIRTLSATYPLLFGQSDRSVFEKYIQQVQAAAKAEEVTAS